METYLALQVPDCRNCYKCIRHCPVKSINFSEQTANIIPDECILCGTCFIKCPQHAKTVRDDTPKVRALLAQHDVYVSVAPSYIARYPAVNMTMMEHALQQLGFQGAGETAEGATVVTHAYEALLASHKQDIVISTCCHSVNLLIQKNFPAVMKYMAKVLSPMQTHAKMLKEQHPGAKVVFIGPCIAKKEEADAYPSIVDAVLTFDELDHWMQAEGVHFEEAPDDRQKGKARLYPIPGGIVRTMQLDRSKYTYLALDGADQCIKALRDIEDGGLKNCFIEMSICEGSCTGGPLMQEHRYHPVTNQVQVEQFAGPTHWPIQTAVSDRLYKNMRLLKKELPEPTEEELVEILRLMGKTSPQDELNCGSCGYNNCRSKALAVYRKKADFTMCLPYLKEKAESFSDIVIGSTPNGIVVLNEKMEIQMMNARARGWFSLPQPSDLIGMKMEQLGSVDEYIDVMLNGTNTRPIKAFPAFGKVIEQSVAYDPNFHVLVIIMRDITDQQAQKKVRDQLKEEALQVTDEVIEKQMLIVQEIARLLGESTAKTQVALTKLQERLQDD